jgi:N-acetylneuraminic acid mutarotase
MPTDLTLDFSSAISGTLLDKDGEGTGFTSVQPNIADNAYDLGRIDLNTSASSLVLTATQGSNASTNTLKNALQVGIDEITQPFTISTRLQGPLTNLNAAYQQGGIFLGSSQDNYVKFVIANTSSGTSGLGLQFFQEQNGVRSSVGGGSGSQIKGLDWASINTLDLFLTGDPATGMIAAAYRVNSDTAMPTSLTQQFKPSSAENFFADETIAHAGILAFTLNGADVPVTFDSFSIKPASSPSPGFTAINWSTAAASPIGRSEAPGVVADGKLYVFGGYINTTFNPTSRSDVYDPVNNTWTRITDLPKPLSHVGTAVDGKDIYLAGGYVGKPTGGQIFATQDVWKYNVDTKTWTAMPSLPQARGSGGMELLGRELHFFGGADINRADKGDHWVLSLDGGTQWQGAAPLPNPRSHLADAVIGGKLYAIGGQHGVDHDLVTQKSVHVWEGTPGTPGTWTAVAGLPRARSHIGAATFVMNGRIIVAAGEISHESGGTVSDVTAYDPLANSWKALTPLPKARHSGVAGSIGNQIFYTTGSPGFSSKTYRGSALT